jgi:transcriptional regulator of arginine metabolism
VVASALDRSVLDGVLGSVAGDDTILVISSDERGGDSLAAEFRVLAGFAEPLVVEKKEK